ncbi:MAG: transposase [Bacteroidota bacterium]
MAYQLSDGVDLMQIHGVSYSLLMTLVSETGLNLSDSFASAKHFTSWLGLAPNKRITGGKIISNRTQKKKNRLANAFRKAANSVGRQKDTPLGDFFRRIAFKKNRAVAITATARKIAVIVYHMLSDKQSFKPMGSEEYAQKIRQMKVARIQKTIQKLSISLDELKS